MGVGKSTLGNALAKELEINFIDLDAYIEQKEGKSISDLFVNKAEISFRKKETNYLKQILTQESSFVLALGGGTPCYANNMELINLYSKNTFYLKASFQFLSKRLHSEKNVRPLLQHLNQIGEFEDFIRKHLFERQNYYFLANTTINVETQSIENNITQILNQLN